MKVIKGDAVEGRLSLPIDALSGRQASGENHRNRPAWKGKIIVSDLQFRVKVLAIR